MRPLAFISVLAILSACHSAPPPKATAVEENRASHQPRIVVGVRPVTPKMIRQPRPAYPKAAKKAGIQGVVQLNIVVAKTGEVSEVYVVCGHPALVPAAVKAVRQWQFAPMELNGEPIEIKTTIALSFSLKQ